jgi:Na+:H+ antiporter, NhaA family
MSTEPQDNKSFGMLYAPWEKGFSQLMTPFERFVKHQATGGLILMFTAVVALILANGGWSDVYQNILHTSAGFHIEQWKFDKTIHHWVNDGLMALFFFVVGLELKREILVGELSSPRLAALPIVAAIGGMVLPALVYYVINPDGSAARGWGIPMATDIAFALGVIALLAGRVPKSLITFLVALAIVDDLGAVVVIALFYTKQLIWQFLIIGAGLTGLMLVMNLVGIRKPLLFFLVGTLLWLALLKSGVHATLAGVITAFMIPAIPRFDPSSFGQSMKELLVKYEDSYTDGESILKNQRLAAVVQTMEKRACGVETPMQRLEHSMHGPVAFFILPLFALFNAGVQIDFANIGTALAQPVTIGVTMGLIIGKFIGIAGLSWIAVKLGWVALPHGVRMAHIYGAALLGSIGFTMSIFIAELAFAQQPQLILQAKLGILIASVLAGIAGYLWLYWLGKPLKAESKSS